MSGGGEAMFWAEADGITPSGNVIAFVISNLGVVGILVWYLWFVTSKESPKARKDFLDALDGIADRYMRLVEGERAAARECLDGQHSLVMAMQDLSDAVREAMDLKRPKRPATNPPPPA
jgi:hypothetical protein